MLEPSVGLYAEFMKRTITYPSVSLVQNTVIRRKMEKKYIQSIHTEFD